MLPSRLRPTPAVPLAVRFAVPIALGLALATATVAAAQWRPEGPFAAVVRDVAFDPTDPSRVYAATVAGGVWRSADGGRSWELPSGDMTNYTVEWIEVDPGNPATLWVGIDQTGGGSAMFRSIDRGASWKAVQDAAQGEGGRMHPVGQRVAFGPKSTIWVPSTNLHYRSDDGGKTWRDFRVPNQDAYAIAVHPTDPKVVLAGGRGESLNVSRSVDGGKTWRQTGIGLGQSSVKRLFFDPADPQVVSALAGTFGSFFKSTDGGDEWAQRTLPVGGTDEVFDLVIAPGTRTLWAATEGGLLRSSDGGDSWEESRAGLGGYLVRTVAFHPTDPRRLLAATGGTGVYVSGDGGDSWEPTNQGLAAGWTEELFGRDGSPAVWAQLSVGLFRLDGPGAWTEVQAPFADGEAAELDGMLFDRNNPQVVYAHEGSSYWTSTDGGRRWQEAEKKEPSMRDMMRGNLASPEFKSLAQDAGNVRTLYAGVWSSPDPGQAVWRTTDGGKTWKPAGAGLPDEAVQRLVSTAPETVLAVVDSDQLWRTTGGGSSWSRVGDGLPGEELRELAVDPRDATIVLVATEKGLFRSTDGGATFAKAGGALGEEDVEAVAFDGRGGAWAGTFSGVFRSSDGGTTWSALSDGLPNTDVRALAVAGTPARLYAGIAGGSVWSMPLP